jgi:tetratricopeptide (TPR) repeat protein
MVQRDEATERFRLHDLARDYARSLLGKKERAAYEQRHSRHYVQVLKKANTLYKEGAEVMLQGLALFDCEWSNICAGQAWAALNWRKKTVARLCSEYPEAGIRCLKLRLHPRIWIAWLDAALRAARRLKDLSSEAKHLNNLGNACTKLGEFSKSIDFHQQQLIIVRRIGNRLGEGHGLGNLGNAYLDLGEPKKAIEYYEQFLALARELGYRHGEGNVLGNLGRAYYVLGMTQKAIGYHEEELAIAIELGDRHDEGTALGNLGKAFMALGEPLRAIRVHEQQLAIACEIGDTRSAGNAHFDLATELAETDRYEEAICHAQKAVLIYRQIESPYEGDSVELLKSVRKHAEVVPNDL